MGSWLTQSKNGSMKPKYYASIVSVIGHPLLISCEYDVSDAYGNFDPVANHLSYREIFRTNSPPRTPSPYDRYKWS